MIKRILLLSSLLVTSMTAHAGLIQYGDYKRDSASNIVTGGGLEWLKWDVTKGMSINSAVASYAPQGWRLATYNDMASMFNHFEFGKTDWTAVEDQYPWIRTPWTSSEGISQNAAFIRLFGATYTNSCSSYSSSMQYCYSDDDPFVYSYAFFGPNEVGQGRFKDAYVVDDGLLVSGGFYPIWYKQHEAGYEARGNGPNDFREDAGVALVRNSVPDNVAVPTPGSIGLLALGLVALGYCRRHVLGR